MGTVFDVWVRGEVVVMCWTAGQVVVAVYSIVLMFGTVPIQIVMFYIKYFILMLCFLYLSISTFMFIVPLVLIIVSPEETMQRTYADYIMIY